MPATPKRTQIRNKIAEILQTISAGATYHTNLGQHVGVWRPINVPFQQSELPALNIRDRNNQNLRSALANPNDRWTREAQFEIDVIATSPEEYDKCVADIYTALKADHTLAGLAEDVNCSGETADVDQEESRINQITTTILVLYRTGRFEA